MKKKIYLEYSAEFEVHISVPSKDFESIGIDSLNKYKYVKKITYHFGSEDLYSLPNIAYKDWCSTAHISIQMKAQSIGHASNLAKTYMRRHLKIESYEKNESQKFKTPNFIITKIKKI